MTDYTVAKDARAAITNAYFDLVPYTSPMLGWGFFPRNQVWVQSPSPPPLPPAPRPRNVVLPKRPPG